MIADSRDTSGQILDGLTQNIGADAQQRSTKLRHQAEQLLRSEPDQALQLARKSLVVITTGIAEASRQASEWSREQTDAGEAVAELRLSLQTAIRIAKARGNSDKELAGIAQQLTTATTALRLENLGLATDIALAGQDQLRQIEQRRHQQLEQEEIRREIVRGFRQVLLDMGFTVAAPRMVENDQNGRVLLSGRLPSGRTARFAIALDGHVDYDFDGYRQRDCGKDHDTIRRRLQEQCLVEATRMQVHWKDEPVQIGKTVLDLPVSRNRKLS